MKPSNETTPSPADPERPQASSVAHGSAKRQWTDEECHWLLREIETMSKLKEADNRKLLWLAKNTKAWKDCDLFGVESKIYAEIENRLYPEYDGETVTFEEWGWRTPEGDVRYLPNDKVSDGGPLTPESKQDANPPFAAPLG